MGLRINTNIISLKAQRNLGSNREIFNKALERLSSGSRINQAGDDAAGLAVSEGLRSQVRGLQQAVRNSNDGVGFLQTAEGALQESTNIAQRVRELAIQAANGTISDTDRQNLNNEVQSLISEFDRIATSTEFNGVFLLDGTFSTTDLQVGIRKGQSISFTIGNARASSLGSLASVSGVQHALSAAANFNIIGSTGTGTFTAAVAGDDTLSYTGNAYSAIALAKKINSQSGTTGVYADVLSNVVALNGMSISAWSLTSSQANLTSGQFKINNVSVTGDVSTVAAFIQSVNNVANSTGVRATLASGTTANILLTAADGRNITLSFATTQLTTGGAFITVGFSLNQGSALSTNVSFTTGSIASTGGTYTLSGAVKIRSAAAFTVSSASTTLGVAGQSVAIDTSTAFNSVSVSTKAAASDALAIVDSTLRQLATLRAGFGAVQNRLQSSVTNLSVTVENLAAAQSQIRDADIALETAELTKAQILQEAGIAVLGQANTSAQAALQLLRFQ